MCIAQNGTAANFRHASRPCANLHRFGAFFILYSFRGNRRRGAPFRSRANSLSRAERRSARFSTPKRAQSHRHFSHYVLYNLFGAVVNNLFNFLSTSPPTRGFCASFMPLCPARTHHQDTKTPRTALQTGLYQSRQVVIASGAKQSPSRGQPLFQSKIASALRSSQ